MTDIVGKWRLEDSGDHDALHIDPPSDLKSWLNLGPEDALRLRKAVYGL